MARLQPVRGTHDILPEDGRRFRHIVETFRDIAERYGMAEIATPVFEFTEVFKRSLGETTDVVMKEMYTFEDRSGDLITLRPEYTAGIVRAFISGGMHQNLPCKFYAWGPMFRHERPQKGRLRQFHQLDVEVLGAAEPTADIEVLALAWDLLSALGLADKVTLELNSLGDADSRATYRAALVDYFSAHKDRLSRDSLDRLERNPLRILDSKDEGDRAIIASAPLLTDYLNPDSAAFFDAVRAGLDALGIPYTVNPRLVRGLDYYTHTAFEFTTEALGAQGTVLAGGRYDGLVEQLGGPPTPGIGWASGIERLAMLVDDPAPARRPIAVVPLGEAAEREALVLCHRLRRDGFVVDMAYRGNLGKRMKRANKVNARAAVILGDDELTRDAATVRDLDSGEQREVAMADIAAALAPYRQQVA
ncbi:MAG: histidine--tRNA ligase [Alphaproteobacteria bacterium]|nr:MAG: histidine--tRNA ligase [Alphaproteobacteria bacterium]